jgi:hypothetical protein
LTLITIKYINIVYMSLEGTPGPDTHMTFAAMASPEAMGIDTAGLAQTSAQPEGILDEHGFEAAAAHYEVPAMPEAAGFAPPQSFVDFRDSLRGLQDAIDSGTALPGLFDIIDKSVLPSAHEAGPAPALEAAVVQVPAQPEVPSVVPPVSEIYSADPVIESARLSSTTVEEIEAALSGAVMPGAEIVVPTHGADTVDTPKVDSEPAAALPPAAEAVAVETPAAQPHKRLRLPQISMPKILSRRTQTKPLRPGPRHAADRGAVSGDIMAMAKKAKDGASVGLALAAGLVAATAEHVVEPAIRNIAVPVVAKTAEISTTVDRAGTKIAWAATKMAGRAISWPVRAGWYGESSRHDERQISLEKEERYGDIEFARESRLRKTGWTAITLVALLAAGAGAGEAAGQGISQTVESLTAREKPLDYTQYHLALTERYAADATAPLSGAELTDEAVCAVLLNRVNQASAAAAAALPGSKTVQVTASQAYAPATGNFSVTKYVFNNGTTIKVATDDNAGTIMPGTPVTQAQTIRAKLANPSVAFKLKTRTNSTTAVCAPSTDLSNGTGLRRVVAPLGHVGSVLLKAVRQR